MDIPGLNAPSFDNAFASTPTPGLFGGAGGFGVPSTGGGAPTPGSKRDAGSAFGAKEQETSQKRADNTWKPRDGGIGGEPMPDRGGNSFSSASATPNGASPFGKVVKEGDIRVPMGEAIKFGVDTIILTAIQGDKRRSSTIHKALFSERAGLFKEALDSEPDRREQTVEGDGDGLGLALYVQFLYTGRLPIRSNTTDEHAALCKLYTLATKLRDTIAKNAALDAIYIMAKEGNLPSNEHVAIMYGGSPGPCSARRMLVDLYTQKATGQEMVRHAFPVAFMVELATSMAVHRAVPNDNPWTHGGTSGDYHDE